MSRAEELKAQGEAKARAELLPLLEEKDEIIIARLQRELEENKLTPSKS